jgi:hypothetical protein
MAVGGAGFPAKMPFQPMLLPGEQIQHTLTADGFFLGSNPMLKLFAALQSFFVTITGGHVRIFLIVTDSRFLVVTSIQALCGFTRTRVVKAISLANLAQTGWGRATEWCCINSRSVMIQTKTEKLLLMVKKVGDPELRAFHSAASAVVVANSRGGTAT